MVLYPTHELGLTTFRGLYLTRLHLAHIMYADPLHAGILSAPFITAERKHAGINRLPLKRRMPVILLIHPLFVRLPALSGRGSRLKILPRLRLCDLSALF